MNGNFAGGDGTADNPYLIEDAQDLDAVTNHMSASYKLINNIEYNKKLFEMMAGNFTGNFDGNSHTINNLYISNSAGSYVGLFGFVQKAIIKNLGLLNINVIGKTGVGAFFGGGIDTTIINCYATGIITGNSYTGGLIGCYNTSRCVLTNSYSNCKVTGNSYTGGLIGKSVGTISNCYWDKETSGVLTSSGGTGLTTSQMKDPSNFTDWDKQMLDDGITPVWKLKEGEYPKLWFEKPPIKYLIKDNNKYKYTQDGNVLNTIANEDTLYNNFNTYGMNDLTNINENIINVLENSKYNISMLR